MNQNLITNEKDAASYLRIVVIVIRGYIIMRYAKLLIDRRNNGCVSNEYACHMVIPIPFDAEGVKLEVIQCSTLSGNGGCSLIRITDSNGSFEKEFEQQDTSNEYGECSVSKISKNKYLATITNNNCRLSHLLSESNVFLTSAVPRSEYEVEWTLFSANSSNVHNFMRKLNDAGYHVELLAGSDASFTNLLTERQFEFIKYAFDNGYYDVPKGITIDDLKVHFKCSKSTASVILRSAEKKLLAYYFMLNRGITPHKK